MTTAHKYFTQADVGKFSDFGTQSRRALRAANNEQLVYLCI